MVAEGSSVGSPPPTSDNTAPSTAGATITISKSPIKKGTITLRTAEENKTQGKVTYHYHGNMLLGSVTRLIGQAGP